MAAADIPVSFTAATPALAAEVNQNFDYVQTFLNGSVSHKDGSVAYTGVPSGPASDATTDNQFVRKAMLDNRTKVVAQYNGTVDLSPNYGYDNTWRWLGASCGSVAFPTIPAGAIFTVSAYIPVLNISTRGGGFPLAGAVMDVGLFSNAADTDRISLARVNVGALSGIQPDGIPSVFVRRMFTSQTITAGTMVNFQLRGRIPAGNGQFNLVGAAEYPIQIMAKMG